MKPSKSEHSNLEKLQEAIILQAELLDEQYNLERQADETFPPKEIQLKTKVKYVPFNIASRKQIAERLIEKGWKPDKHTEKGNIIVSEEVLSKIKNIPEAEMFSRYFLLQKTCMGTCMKTCIKTVPFCAKHV